RPPRPHRFPYTTLFRSLSRRRVVEDAGLSGRDALLARDQFDLETIRTRAQPCRLRRPRRTHAHEHLDARADHAVERAVADPVDRSEEHTSELQSLAYLV